MSEYRDTIIEELKNKETLDTRFFDTMNQVLDGQIKKLLLEKIIHATVDPEVKYELTPAGEEVLISGSSAWNTFTLVPPEGMLLSELEEKVGGAKVLRPLIGLMYRNKWLNRENTDAGLFLTRADGDHRDVIQDTLKQFVETMTGDKKTIKALKGLIKKITITHYILRKGECFENAFLVFESDLTVEMLADDKYKELNFKPYNMNSRGVLNSGNLHPLLKTKTQFRQIFLEMGFNEMDTSNWVESSFWNFDSLFQPQQHPARDAHDTFFMELPAKSELPEGYKDLVRDAHENGGLTDSIGWRYTWSEEEAAKNILRTHTTACSSRHLYNLLNEAKKNGFKPMRMFSIDRVFRNETVDATHLAEFHQIEGWIIGEKLALCDLMGVIENFFHRMGLTDIRFKAAYNPYTEPSMEILAYHPGLKKHIEIGNSGIFRPEMIRTMLGEMNDGEMDTLPDDLTVVAWGLGLERSHMLSSNVSKIRDLFGHEVSLEDIDKCGIQLFQ
ncbi:hypothetical protein PCE1_002389 [Barthelona sp. PCE]